MCRRFSSWLYQVSTGWVALAALVVFVSFTALVLPGQAAQGEGEAADAGSPDVSLWYTPAELYRMAEAYGLEGRQAYIRARFTFDVAWPLVYGAFLITAISWLYARAFPPASAFRSANLAPALGVLLDFAENVSTSLVMARYPGRTPGIDALAPVFTLAKWAFVGGSFLLLAIGAGAALWQWLVKARAERQP